MKNALRARTQQSKTKGACASGVGPSRARLNKITARAHTTEGFTCAREGRCSLPCMDAQVRVAAYLRLRHGDV